MIRGIFVVFAKEAIDNARDRRSLLMALIYPLMGPLLLGVIISVITDVGVADPGRTVILPVQGAEHAPHLIAYLKGRGVTVVPAPADPKAAVRDGKTDTILIIPADHDTLFQAQKTAPITVIANASRLPGLLALNRMGVLLGDYNQKVWGRRLVERGVDHRKLQPLRIESVNVTTGTHFADILIFMVPPLLIFNLFMGGVYLAIDTTSGERERGSLEPLLINPVARWALMLGKFLAALLFTAVAVVVQLIAFKLMLQLAGAEKISFAHALDLAAMAGIFITAFPLMMVAVGVQFIIATITRSFKEAQTYLGLLPLVPAIPGMGLVFAPVQVQEWMMTIPTFSQTLLFGQFLRGEPVSSLNIVISTTVTTALALILVAIAARLYEREKLIFGG